MKTQALRPPSRNGRGGPDKELVRRAAAGRWREILTALCSVDPGILDGRHHACPKCGAGKDRFRAFDDFDQTGGLICNQCFDKKNADGFASVAWLLGCKFNEAIQKVADHVGVAGHSGSNGSASHDAEISDDDLAATRAYLDGLLAKHKHLPPEEVLRIVCERKGMPVDSAVIYGGRHVRAASDDVVAFPCYVPGENGEIVQGGQFFIWLDPGDDSQKDKGKFTAGTKAGLFLPHDADGKPYIPDDVVIVEGVKDAAASHGQRRPAIGLNTCQMAAKFVPWFAGKHLTAGPDQDEDGAGEQGAAATIENLGDYPASVRVARWPIPGDARDVIALDNGATFHRCLDEAIPASEWTPQPPPWKPIDRIEVDETTLPEFPVDVLPEPLQQWVREEAHALQVPPDMPAMIAIGVVSACISRLWIVRPRPGWDEEVCIYACVLMPPAERKSAVFAHATEPLRDVELEEIEAARPAYNAALHERRQTEARLKVLDGAAAKKWTPESRKEAAELAAWLDDQPAPTLPRRLTDDVTPERLEMLMAENGERMASMSAEGGVFDLLAGAYQAKGISKIDIFLKGHCADRVVTDRVNRKGVALERPTLTCVFAMQPQVISGLAEKSTFRGRGLLARFLYVMPASKVGYRELEPDPVTERTASAYRALIRSLATDTQEAVLTLTEHAAAAFLAWRGEVEAMLAPFGEMQNMSDWGGKLCGATLRIAACFHAVSRAADPFCNEFQPEADAAQNDVIDELTMRSAIAVAKYLVPHAAMTLALMDADQGAEQRNECQRLLAWIERAGKWQFTERDAQRGLSRKKDQLDPHLKELEQRGYIRREPPAKPGGKPSTTWLVHPEAFERRE